MPCCMLPVQKLPCPRAGLLPAEAQVFDTRELARLATVMLQMMLELYGGGCCFSTCLLLICLKHCSSCQGCVVSALRGRLPGAPCEQVVQGGLVRQPPGMGSLSIMPSACLCAGTAEEAGYFKPQGKARTQLTGKCRRVMDQHMVSRSVSGRLVEPAALRALSLV